MSVRLVQGDLVRPFATEPVGNVGAVAGTVRLVGAREVGDFYETEFPELKARLKSGRLAESHLYARCIQKWDVLDGGGQVAAITPENVAALPPAVWVQLGDVVTGVAAAAESLLGNSGPSSAS